MTAQDLKNAILQLAVQGKLVPQNPNDEPASELLKRIEVEKAALIKAGRIKKYKTLTALSADDLPFDIPESWCWLKLGSMCQLLDGEKKKGISYPYLEAKFLRGKAAATMNNEGKYVTKGTRLILVDGENSGEVFFATEDGYMGSTFKVLFFPQELFAGYVLYFLQFKQLAFRNNKTGSAIPHLNKELFFNMPFPVPPLAEQERIVAKIEELMTLVEEYGKAEERLTVLNAEFPDKLRKSILQQAIQGKLTERDPADEPASELLKRIRAEKERLIKEGKIKKDRRTEELGVPSVEDITFDIPIGWECVYLGSILNKLTDGTHKTPKYTNSGVKFVSVKDMSNGVLSLEKTKYISEKEHNELYLRCDPMRGDMLLSKVGTTGVPAIVDTDEPFSLFVSVALLKYNHSCINEQFFYYLLQSPLVQEQAEFNTRGAGNKNWVLDAIAKTIIVIPPLAEQQRIVDRVNELLAVCDKLK
ncbi:MAG: restriction endonuclease subunit S [Clostridia bacterium]|nr:restriction endonuclease subunit S [Clostridia bacterium]